MFYSHTFLARKSPLGTVWIAAHLEHKIKRPQIESINIPSFAEKIMMPDVPIALRLSGHLLVGIVRIFSWKVNHLFLDCNRLVTDIRKSFASVPVDLPKEADTAPFEYVTLPETFDLSALELDESYYRTDEPDRHLKSYDQITMKDQLPMEAEQYIAISIEEDNGLNLSPQQSNGLNQSSPATNELASSSQQANSCSISGKLGDETLPPFDGGFESRFQEHILFSGGVSTENEGTTKKTPDGNNSLQDTLDIEKMLYDPHHSAHGADPYGEIPAGQDSSSIQRRKSLSTIREGGTPNPKGDSYHCAEQLADLSANKLNFPDLEASPAILLPILKPKPSPPVKRQNLKKRKRKLAFDRQVVLSNLQMKKQLDESANIVCKRRKLPGSDLDIWKFQRFSEKEAIFCLPLFSKMDSTLFQSFERSHPSVNNNISTEPGGAEPDKEIGTMIADAQLATPSMDAFSDIERARDADNANDLISQFILNTSSFGSESHKEIHSETILRPSAGISSPVEPISLNLETPLHFKEYQLDDTEIPEAPGLLDSADEDLNFLNANGESPRLHDAFQVENLSARTRAVANYFKDNSLEVQPDRSEPISLNRILELKSRKQCSRMFYETLVLKSFDFINIQQEEPYGSILIFPTSALLATKF